MTETERAMLTTHEAEWNRLAHFKRNAAVTPRPCHGYHVPRQWAREVSKAFNAMSFSHRVLVLDSDALTQSMICEWLDADGWQVVEPAIDQAQSDVSLVVVDLPFPRAVSFDALQEIRKDYPGVPVIVMSSTVFGNVGCFGPCAASLGVAGVLPKPVSRDTLIGAARRLARSESECAPPP
jgi:CheY-like chemotaxis protein